MHVLYVTHQSYGVQGIRDMVFLKLFDREPLRRRSTARPQQYGEYASAHGDGPASQRHDSTPRAQDAGGKLAARME